MQCPKCGRSNPDGARFCNGCGTSLPESSSATSSVTGWETAEFIWDGGGGPGVSAAGWVNYADGTNEHLGRLGTAQCMQTLASRGWEVVSSHAIGITQHFQIRRPMAQRMALENAAFQRQLERIQRQGIQPQFQRSGTFPQKTGFWGTPEPWFKSGKRDIKNGINCRIEDGAYRLFIANDSSQANGWGTYLIKTSGISGPLLKMHFSASFRINSSTGNGGAFGIAIKDRADSYLYVVDLFPGNGAVMLYMLPPGWNSKWVKLLNNEHYIHLQNGNNTLIWTTEGNEWNVLVNAEGAVSIPNVPQNMRPNPGEFGFYVQGPIDVTVSSLDVKMWMPIEDIIV